MEESLDAQRHLPRRTNLRRPIARSSHPQDASSDSDEALVAKARNGNDEAFRRLVERHEEQVAATIVGILGPGPEADDAGQETFLKFYDALDQFRGESSVGTYLTRIATNTALDALKKRTRQTSRHRSRDDPDTTLSETAENDTHRAVELSEREQLVHGAIQQLDEKHRTVVVLRMMRGLSTKETAEVLDIPEGTVLSRLYRAKDKLKDVLTPYFEGHDE